MSVLTSPRHGLPATPRSRFSKALPPPPPPGDSDHIDIEKFESAFSASRNWIPPLQNSPSSPRSGFVMSPSALSSTAISSPPPPSIPSKTIPRRPVGSTRSARTVDSSKASTEHTSVRSNTSSWKESFSTLGIDETNGDVPPIPPKDPERRKLRESDASSTRSNTTTSSSSSSPSRPEIWRRRSLKPDGPLPQLPDLHLKLNGSNGSTNTSALPPPQLEHQLPLRPQPAPPPLDRALPALPQQVPAGRTANTLKASNFIPARPAPPQPEMGSKVSKQLQQQEQQQQPQQAFPPRSTSLTHPSVPASIELANSENLNGAAQSITGHGLREVGPTTGLNLGHTLDPKLKKENINIHARSNAIVSPIKSAASILPSSSTSKPHTIGRKPLAASSSLRATEEQKQLPPQPQPSPTTQILASYSRPLTPDYSRSDEEQNPVQTEIRSPASPVSLGTPEKSRSPTRKLLTIPSSRIEEEEGHSATADYLAAMSRPVSEAIVVAEEEKTQQSAPIVFNEADLEERLQMHSPEIKSAPLASPGVPSPTSASPGASSPTSALPSVLQIGSPRSNESPNQISSPRSTQSLNKMNSPRSNQSLNKIDSPLQNHSINQTLSSPPTAESEVQPASAPPGPVPEELTPVLELFNRLAANPSGPGTIFDAAPLSAMHFDCYQRHKVLRESRNHLYPVACMVCETKDMERRMMCTWCSLRCCMPCIKALTSTPGRDLKESMIKMASEA